MVMAGALSQIVRRAKIAVLGPTLPILNPVRVAEPETPAFRLARPLYQYRTISIWPRPLQKPRPPLYMCGSSPEAGEFAARNHIGRRNGPVCAGQLPSRFPELPLRQGTDCCPRHPSLHR
jgi:hypothetical protein